MAFIKASSMMILLLLLGSSPTDVNSFQHGGRLRLSLTNPLMTPPSTLSSSSMAFYIGIHRQKQSVATTKLCMFSTAAAGCYDDFYGGDGGQQHQQRDFYHILGLDRLATPKDIKAAFRKLAKKYHPDLNKSEESTEIFQQVNRAYEVLKDPQMRLKYDMHGEDAIGTSAASDDIYNNGGGGGRGGHQYNSNFYYDQRQQDYYSNYNSDFYNQQQQYRRPHPPPPRYSSSAYSASPQNDRPRQQEEFFDNLVEELGYDPFGYRDSNGKTKYHTESSTWGSVDSSAANWGPDSYTSSNGQIPCDQPNGNDPTPWSFEDMFRAKMGDRDVLNNNNAPSSNNGNVKQAPYDGTARSIPFDEFVREKMKKDIYASASTDYNTNLDENFVNPYLGSEDDLRIGCDQGAHEENFPFRGDDHLFQRTGPGQARSSVESSSSSYVPPEDFYVVGDTVRVQQTFRSSSSSPPRRGRTVPKSSSSSSFFSDAFDKNTPRVQHPAQDKRRVTPEDVKNLVKEASDMWTPSTHRMHP